MPTRPQSRTAQDDKQTGSSAGGQLLDPDKIRAAAARAAKTNAPKGATTAPPPAPPLPPVSDEAKKFWAQQYAAVWNQFAVDRGWPMMPGAPVDPKTGLLRPPDDPAIFIEGVGTGVARTMEQIIGAIDQRPWLQVVVMTFPYALGAVKVEGKRVAEVLRGRRGLARERPPGGGGAERPGKEQPGPESDSSLTPAVAV